MAVQSPKLFTYKLVEHPARLKLASKKGMKSLPRFFSYTKIDLLTICGYISLLPFSSIVLIKLKSQSSAGKLSVNSANAENDFTV